MWGSSGAVRTMRINSTMEQGQGNECMCQALGRLETKPSPTKSRGGPDTGWNAGPQAVHFQSRATPPTLALEPGRPPKVGAGMCHLPGPVPECAQHISECPRRAFIRWPHRSGLAYPDLYLKFWLVPGSWGSLSSPPLARLSLYITKAALTKACSL